MKEIRTEIDIEAPAERVWTTLTDFAKFPEWNPFIRHIRGTLEEGSKLEVSIGASGAKPMTFRPIVKKVRPNRELRWLGRVALPRLFDGEHIFELEAAGTDRVHFVQREVFRGLLVPFLARSLDRDARRGFEEMNRALAKRVTGPPASGPSSTAKG